MSLDVRNFNSSSDVARTTQIGAWQKSPVYVYIICFKPGRSQHA